MTTGRKFPVFRPVAMTSIKYPGSICEASEVKKRPVFWEKKCIIQISPAAVHKERDHVRLHFDPFSLSYHSTALPGFFAPFLHYGYFRSVTSFGCQFVFCLPQFVVILVPFLHYGCFRSVTLSEPKLYAAIVHSVLPVQWANLVLIWPQEVSEYISPSSSLSCQNDRKTPRIQGELWAF